MFELFGIAAPGMQQADVQEQGLFHFAEQSYEFEGMFLGKTLREVAQENAELARAMCQSAPPQPDGPIPAAQILDAHPDWKEFTDDTVQMSRMLETAVLLRWLSQPYPSIQVFTLGFADDSNHSWSKPLPKDMTRGTLHHRNKIKSKPEDYVQHYESTAKNKWMGHSQNGAITYGNAQLANLRGHQAKTLLNLLFAACTDKPASAEIAAQLEGIMHHTAALNDRITRVYFRLDR